MAPDTPWFINKDASTLQNSVLFGSGSSNTGLKGAGLTGALSPPHRPQRYRSSFFHDQPFKTKWMNSIVLSWLIHWLCLKHDWKYCDRRLTSLTHAFHKTCLSLKKGIWLMPTRHLPLEGFVVWIEWIFSCRLSITGRPSGLLLHIDFNSCYAHPLCSGHCAGRSH